MIAGACEDVGCLWVTTLPVPQNQRSAGCGGVGGAMWCQVYRLRGASCYACLVVYACVACEVGCVGVYLCLPAIG